jgi:pimeloyl-ACP methyl ester carboxylesterase
MMLIVKIIFAVILLALLSSFVYHRVCLWREKKKFPPPGKMVDVNGHKMHIYAEGQGPNTFVFLSGGGTPCPSLDFKPLYSRFSQDERIVVVEKAGYGFSESARVPRDIDTILEETRSALKLAGEKGPFYLFPHSLSGIEAIHWAQKYPGEVKALIGLDPGVPPVYESLGENKIKNFVLVKMLMRLIFQTGIYRFIPSYFEKEPALCGNALTDNEKAAYRALCYRNFLTPDHLGELKALYANAKVVGALGAPLDTPMYFFISDGKEVGLAGWQTMLGDYVKQTKNGKYEILNCGHYVHAYEPDHIAQESKKFMTAQKTPAQAPALES